MSRMLIAEDDTLVAAFIDKGPRAHGHATLIVGSGAATVGLALTGEFDLVVLDLGLPIATDWTCSARCAAPAHVFRSSC